MNICGPLARLVEQFPFKEWVDGSSPSGLTNKITLTDINWWIVKYHTVFPF